MEIGDCVGMELKPDCELLRAKQSTPTDVEELARAEVLAWAGLLGCNLQGSRRKNPASSAKKADVAMEGALARLKLCHTVTD